MTEYHYMIKSSDLGKIERLQTQIDALARKYEEKYGSDYTGYISLVANQLSVASAALEEIREHAKIF